MAATIAKPSRRTDGAEHSPQLRQLELLLKDGSEFVRKLEEFMQTHNRTCSCAMSVDLPDECFDDMLLIVMNAKSNICLLECDLPPSTAMLAEWDADRDRIRRIHA